MHQIVNAASAFSRRAREKRASIFRDSFSLHEGTKVLDLGSENGSSIHAVLRGTPVKAGNVYIADIDARFIEEGQEKFGFVPVLIGETGKLPFPDGYFDIVYCSSVIEHVTVPKEKVWSTSSGKAFADESLKRQKAFADEIQRVGKQYFVQTPYKHFPIESHSWLPFIAWLPRPLLLQVLRFTNLFWVKTTNPDWHLLDRKDMAGLFAGTRIVSERVCGVTKSIMAVKSTRPVAQGL